MLIVSLVHGRNVIVAGQGGILPIMNSTNELMEFVNIDTTHIPDSEYLGMKLGCITEGQERQPGISTGQMAFVGKTRRYHKS
nr:hypothetical protein HKBLJLKJ_00162 [Porcine reproductive and respiratory syndrome virus]